MSKFLTDKEIEPETRILPIPEHRSTLDGERITTFKKIPVTMMKTIWESFDFLISKKHLPYSKAELVVKATNAALDNGLDFDINLQYVVVDSVYQYDQTQINIYTD